MAISKPWVGLAFLIFLLSQFGFVQEWIQNNVDLVVLGYDLSDNVANIISMLSGIIAFKSFTKGVIR